jgi:hypothetical protein
MYRLGSRAACVDALRAVMGGDLATGFKSNGNADALLPLSGPSGMQPGEFTSVWLGDVVASLLERASVLGLGRAAASESGAACAGPEAVAWEEAVAKLIGMLMAHVAMVLQVGPQDPGLLRFALIRAAGAPFPLPVHTPVSLSRVRLAPFFYRSLHPKKIGNI